MFRIDNNSAIPTLPTPGPPGTPGFFTDGNPAAALEATIVDAWWANMLQEEIITVINAASIPLDKASHTQLFEALHQLYGGPSGIPEAPIDGNTYGRRGSDQTWQPVGTSAGDFLPLSGGQLYRANASDILSILVDAGHQSRINFTVGATRTWLVGPRHNGIFFITDQSAAAADRFWIDTTGAVYTQTGLNVGDYINAYGNITAQYGNLFIAGTSYLTGLVTTGGHVAVGDSVTAFNHLTATYGNLFVGGTSYLTGLVTTGGHVAVGDSVTAAFNLTAQNGNLWIGGVGYIQNDLRVENDVTCHSLHGSQDGDIHLAWSLHVEWDVFAFGGMYVGAHNLNAPVVLASGNQPGGYTGIRVNGTAQKTGGGPWDPIVSERRFKRDVVDYTRGLAALRQLNPVSYRYLPEVSQCEASFVGLCVEDVEGVMPEIITEHDRGKTISAGPITYALINAVKTLADRLEVLEKKEG